jgi:hypothetical protein
MEFSFWLFRLRDHVEDCRHRQKEQDDQNNQDDIHADFFIDDLGELVKLLF